MGWVKVSVVVKNLRQLVVVTMAAAILEKLGLSLAYYQLGTSSAYYQLGTSSAYYQLGTGSALVYIYVTSKTCI